jgi:hypothetical protein
VEKSKEMVELFDKVKYICESKSEDLIRENIKKNSKNNIRDDEMK